MRNLLGVCVCWGALGLAACGDSHGGSTAATGGAGKATGGAAGPAGRAGSGGNGDAGKMATREDGGSSGQGGSGGDTFDSTLPDAEQLGALSPADATKFCEEMNAWDLERSKAQLEAGCRLQGEVTARALLGSSDAIIDLGGASTGGGAGDGGSASVSDKDLQDACQQGYQQCQDGNVTVLQPDCAMPNFTAGECTATVADGEACKNEMAQAYQQSLDQALSCADITAAELRAPGDESTLGSACFAIATKCPGFLEFHFEASPPAGP